MHTFICEGVTIDDGALVAAIPPIGQMVGLLEWATGSENRVFYVYRSSFRATACALRMVKEHSEWIGIRSPGFLTLFA